MDQEEKEVKPMKLHRIARIQLKYDEMNSLRKEPLREQARDLVQKKIKEKGKACKR